MVVNPGCVGCGGTGKCRIVRQGQATVIECPICWERHLDAVTDRALEKAEGHAEAART